MDGREGFDMIGVSAWRWLLRGWSGGCRGWVAGVDYLEHTRIVRYLVKVQFTWYFDDCSSMKDMKDSKHSKARGVVSDLSE